MDPKHPAKGSATASTGHTTRPDASLPLQLPIWVTKGPSDEPFATSCSATTGLTLSARLKSALCSIAFWKRGTSHR